MRRHRALAMESFDKSDQLEERLGAEKFLEVANARRAMWTGGFGGLLLGAALSTAYLSVFPLAREALPELSTKQRLGHHRSKIWAVVMLGGAAGSYLGAVFHGTPALQRFSTVWRPSGE